MNRKKNKKLGTVWRELPVTRTHTHTRARTRNWKEARRRWKIMFTFDFIFHCEFIPAEHVCVCIVAHAIHVPWTPHGQPFRFSPMTSDHRKQKRGEEANEKKIVIILSVDPFLSLSRSGLQERRTYKIFFCSSLASCSSVSRHIRRLRRECD